MKIIQPYAKIITVKDKKEGINLLRHIEFCARISHRSEEAQTEDSWHRFLTSVVINHGDWSVVEHSSVTVDMYCDRGITHEIVRHRLFAFTQESTRFVSYEKKMPASFIIPDSLSAEFERAGNGEQTSLSEQQIWAHAIDTAEQSYKRLIALKVPPQIARSVFPNALASRIMITGNLRNWRHFLNLRTTKESHPQMRELTIPLLREFQEKIPIFFDDIEPEITQREAMKKPR